MSLLERESQRPLVRYKVQGSWLGTALGGRSEASREREGQLRVLTHNLMLLAAHK